MPEYHRDPVWSLSLLASLLTQSISRAIVCVSCVSVGEMEQHHRQPVRAVAGAGAGGWHGVATGGVLPRSQLVVGPHPRDPG